MTMNQACLDGIARFGSRWKIAGPQLQQYSKIIGLINDKANDGETLTTDDAAKLQSALRSLITNIENWLNGKPVGFRGIAVEQDVWDEVKDYFDRHHADDLEMLKETNIAEEVEEGTYESIEEFLDEVNATLNDLFDTLDHYRILQR